MAQHHTTKNTRFQHWPIIAVVVIFIILASIYSLFFPIEIDSDEISHFALVHFIAEHNRPPLTLEERDVIGKKGDASPLYHSLVAFLTQHTDVPDPLQLPELDLNLQRYIPYDGHVPQNLFHTQDNAFPFHGIALAWHLARLVSIPLGAATIIGIYLTVLAIYPERRYFALAAACFAAFIPGFVISSAVVNDDNLLFSLTTFSVFFLIRLAQGDEQPRTLIILGVLIGLAAFAKYHGVILLIVMTLLLLQLAWQKKWQWRTLARRWGLVMLAFTLTFGWWFVFLIIRFNQIEVLGLVRGVLAVLGDPVITSGVDDFLKANSQSLIPGDWLNWAYLTSRTFWFRSSSTYSGLKATGKLSVYWGVYVIINLIMIVAVWGLLKRIWRHRHSWKLHPYGAMSWRPDVTVLVLVFLSILGIVVARHIMQPSFVTAQGRHLFPALVSIAFFFVSGWDEMLQSFDQREGNLAAWLTSSKDHVLAITIGGGFLGLSLLVLNLFIIPTFYPLLPIISTDPDQIPIAHRVETSFADGLDFVGFDLKEDEVEAGTALPMTLYWHVGKEQVRDYLVTICLHDEQGHVVSCRQRHPVDGRYPMRAWESDYVIQDRIYLPTPACLPAGSYELWLSVLPLRLDRPVSVIDETVQPAAPLSLAKVLLTASQHPQANDVDLWVEGKRHNQGSFVLTQLRQALTVIHYQPTSNLPNDQKESVRLSSAKDSLAPGNSWSPISPAVTYHCPGGLTATTHNFVVDPAITRGTYHLVMSEQPDTKFRVKVLTRARDLDPPDEIPFELNALFAEQIELLGYDVDLAPRQPGDVINVTAYWRALRTMTRPYISSIHLLDNTLTMWGQYDNYLGGTYPHLLWAPGEYVKEDYSLTIAPNAPPGLHSIEFGVYHHVLGENFFLPVTTVGSPEPSKHIILGQVRVLDPERTKPPDHPLIVELGQQIRLLGFDLSSQDLSADEPLDLTLHWQTIDQPTADYTVFTQLIGPDGQVWGQQDNQPQGGRYPTTFWEHQDLVLDRYKLSLREGAPPGQYQLLVGMYKLQTGQRLPAVDAEDNRLPHDAIPLATFQLNREL